MDLAPGGAAAIQFVVFCPSKPDVNLSYEVGDTDVALDGPHVLWAGGP